MPVIQNSDYEAPYLLYNQHIATVLPNLMRWAPKVNYAEEKIELLDGDFLELSWSTIGADRVVVISHGLGGDTNKPYVRGLVKALNSHGWDAVAWHLRGCGKEMNRLPRFYHGGDTPDLHAVITHAIQKHSYRKVSLVGFSLGGNITTRYLGERGDDVLPQISAAVAISAPVDLKASADHLSTGSRVFYMKFFVAGYKKKLRIKHKMMPDKIDITGLDDLRTFREFDSRYNTLWYGFPDADTFYHETSSGPLIHRIKVPTLFLSALNDPFLPDSCYPHQQAEQNKHVWLETPNMGGHLGFFSFRKGGSYYHEERALEFLHQHAGSQGQVH